jgi:ATP-dependent DNA ligase
MLPRPRALLAGFIAPCLPIKAPQPPSGEQWLHEIKHDGFRIIARKDGKRVKLYSRPGNDLSYRFPLVVEVIFGSFRAHFAHVCVSPGDSDPNRG